MAASQLRKMKVWLIVLCTIIALVNGGTSRGASSSRRSSFRTSYSSSSYSRSTSGSGASLTTGQIVGIVFGCIGGIIAIIGIPILLVRYCRKRQESDERDQTVKDNYKNNVADAASDHAENSTTTTFQLDPLKLPLPEPTVYGSPGDDRYAAMGTTLLYPPPYSASTPVNYDGTKA